MEQEISKYLALRNQISMITGDLNNSYVYFDEKLRLAKSQSEIELSRSGVNKHLTDILCILDELSLKIQQFAFLAERMKNIGRVITFLINDILTYQANNSAYSLHFVGHHDKVLSLCIMNVKLICFTFNANNKELGKQILQLWIHQRDEAKIKGIYLSNIKKAHANINNELTKIEGYLFEAFRHTQSGDTNIDSNFRVLLKLIRKRLHTQEEQAMIDVLFPENDLVQTKDVSDYSDVARGILSCSMSSYDANVLGSLFGHLSIKINSLLTILQEDFSTACQKVQDLLRIAKAKCQQQQAASIYDKLKEAAQCFNAMIVELQYHDIIRQRLEHVHYIAHNISKEFNQLARTNDQSYPALSVLFTDLSLLCNRQLEDIQDDYMASYYKIQRQLFHLWLDKSLSKELNLILFSTSTQIKNINTVFLELRALSHELCVAPASFSVSYTDEFKRERLEEIKAIYTMQSEREIHHKLFGWEEEVTSDMDDDIFF